MNASKIVRSKWTTPLVSLALGLAFLAGQWSNGRLGTGLAMLGIMAAVSVALLAGGRSDTIRGLRGDGRDERFALIDIRATALAGTAVTTAAIVAFVVELMRGQDGAPYSWLGAIGGAVYLIGLVIGRVRG